MRAAEHVLFPEHPIGSAFGHLRSFLVNIDVKSQSKERAKRSQIMSICLRWALDSGLWQERTLQEMSARLELSAIGLSWFRTFAMQASRAQAPFECSLDDAHTCAWSVEGLLTRAQGPAAIAVRDQARRLQF
jgi:hypothetical protein